MFAAAIVVCLSACSNSGHTAPDYDLSYLSSLTVPHHEDPADADLTILHAPNDQDPLCLDLPQLEQFRTVSFSSYDPWLESTREFTGVYLYELLMYAGTEENDEVTVTVRARNEYEVTIGLDAVKKYGYLLSYMENGTRYVDMGVTPDNKGPLALAADIDDLDDAERETVATHLVWWVKEIIIAE